MIATTLKDIADKAGVHPSTVSRVLRDKEEIQASTKKREHIIRLARELNYQPNQMARSFRLRKSQTIGYIVSDISNPFYALFAKIIEQEGTKKGFSLIICNTFGKLDKEEEYINNLYSRGIEGIIISPASPVKSSIVHLGELEIPFVAFGQKKLSKNTLSDKKFAKKIFLSLLNKMTIRNEELRSTSEKITTVAV